MRILCGTALTCSKQMKIGWVRHVNDMKTTAVSILLAAGLLQIGTGLATQSSEVTWGPSRAPVSAARSTSVDVGGTLYDAGTVSANGRSTPRATAHASDNLAVLFDVGYDVTKELSVQMMVGVPPKAGVTGAGSVVALGDLGKVRYAPVTVTGYYHFPKWGAFQAYAGLGAAYSILRKEPDAAVARLQVDNSWGSVLQAGAHYDLGRKCELFFDIKQIWLAASARGVLASGVAVARSVRLDPALISAGIKVHFD